MSTQQTIDATIFASSHPDIVKRTNVSELIFSCILLVAGVLAFAVTFGLEDKSSTLSMALMVLGTGLLLLAVFRLCWKAKRAVYLPTGSATKEHSLFFDLRYKDELSTIIQSGSFPLDADIRSEHSGNVRMDVILSKDTKFAAVQLFQFIPYTYQPVTSVHYYTGNDASSLAAFLTKSRSQR